MKGINHYGCFRFFGQQKIRKFGSSMLMLLDMHDMQGDNIFCIYRFNLLMHKAFTHALHLCSTSLFLQMEDWCC